MKVAIIDYHAGNVQSVLFALARIGVQAQLTQDIEVIQRADKVIFPGVGEASSTMKYLQDRSLDQVIVSLKQPVMGICLGMQLLCEYSEENDTECLGVIPQKVRRFVPQKHDDKVPHMGWNQISRSENSFLPASTEGAYAYFVHSYFVENGPYTTATSQHILSFSAAIQKDNFWATQFHPEKSGLVGEAILKGFLNSNL